VRSRPRYLLELLIQVSIEIVLGREDMKMELDREPSFRRLAYDALYYISREWSLQKTELRLDDAGKKDFEDYLYERMTGNNLRAVAETSWSSEDNEKVAVLGPLLSPSVAEHSSSDVPLLAPDQIEFLWQQVQELSGFLAEPASARERARESGFPAAVLKALDASHVGSLMEPLLTEGAAGTGSKVYRWRHADSGRVLASGARPKAQEEPDWKEDGGFIESFAKKLDEVTETTINPGTLSVRLGILSTTPAWPSVQVSLERLNRSPSTPYTERSDDIAIVKGYAEVLRRGSQTVLEALSCGALLGLYTRGRD
jgi:hypothetical protein